MKKAGQAPTRRLTVTTPATLACGAIVAQLVASKATRDGLFLSTFDVTLLPRVAAASAVASVAAALLFSRALARWSPGRVVPVALVASASCYLGEWVLSRTVPRVSAALLYVHVAVFAGTLLAGFWSLLAESFDPHSAKRAVGRIAMGGTVGGVLGGLSGFWLGRSLGPAAMLLPLAAINVLGAPLVSRVARSAARAKPRAAQTAPSLSGLRTLRQVPYLRLLALLTVLCATGSALLDYALSANVALVYPRGPALITFFALFHTTVGVGAFLLQAAFTRPALERLGLAGTIVLLPLVILVGCAFAWVEGGLWSTVVLRGADAIMGASLYRAAYELLYTPLPPHQKRPSKVLIDVGVDRLGTAVGSGLVVLLLLVPQPRHALLATACGLAVAVALTALRVHGAYVAALARSLRSGVVLLRSSDVIDATTRRTLADSAALSRGELLKRIEALHVQSELPSIAPPEPEADEEDDEVIPESTAAGFVAAPRSLRWDVPVEPVHELIERLADDHASRAALQALRGVAEASLDVLCAALLDSTRSDVVRRRLPRVLEVVEDERAVTALVEGLFAAELDVRQQCVLALLELTERCPNLVLPADRIEAAAERETLLGTRATKGASPLSPELRVRTDRGIEFTLLAMSLVLDREPMKLALRALYGSDAALRGTALEYLHVVLPRTIRESGSFMLDEVPKRPQRELADELLRSRPGPSYSARK